MTDNRRQWAATTYSLGSPIPDGLLRVGVVNGDTNTPANVLPVELNYGVPQAWQRPVAAIPFGTLSLVPPNLRAVADFGFNPKTLANLAVWLDANDPTTLYQDSALTTPAAADGDPVGGWKDKSGNANHATQGTASARPTLKLAIRNGRPVVRFDGTDDQVVCASAFAGQFFTCLAAVVSGPIAAEDTYASTRVASTNGFELEVSSTRVLARGFNAGAQFNAQPVVGTTVQTWLIASATYGATQLDVRMNGSQGAVGGTPSAGVMDASTQALTIGTKTGASGSGRWDGDIGELLIYSRALSDAERQLAEAYLSTKWAVGLA